MTRHGISRWLRRCHCLALTRCAIWLLACWSIITTQALNDLQEAGTRFRADSGQYAVVLDGVRVHVAVVPLERPLIDCGEDDVEAGLGHRCDFCGGLTTQRGERSRGSSRSTPAGRESSIDCSAGRRTPGSRRCF